MRPYPASLPAAVLVVVLFSGCAANDMGEPSPTAIDASPAPPEPTEAPKPTNDGRPMWSTTTRWTWSLTSQTQPMLQFTTGVTKDAGDAYHVGIDTQANFERAYPLHVLPLGAVSKTDLSWDAHGKPVSLLRFPLKDDETWTGDLFMGAGLSFHVQAAQIQTPNGAAQGYAVNVSYPAGGVALQADYAPSIGQFVRIATYFGNPEPFAQATLTGVSDSAAALQTYAASEILRKNAPAGQPPSAPAQFSVTAGEGFVLVACFMGGGEGAFAATVAAPDGWHGDCNHTNTSGQTAVVLRTASHPRVAGSWSASAAPPAKGFTNIEVFLVQPLL